MLSDNSTDDSQPSPYPSYYSRTPIYNYKINHLTSTLKDTTRNLKSLGKLMETYKDVGLRTSGAIQRTRNLRSNSVDGLNRRDPNLSDGFIPLAQHDLNSGIRASQVGPLSTNVSTDLHELHQNVRDLASKQSWLQSEIDHINRTKGDKSSISHLAEHVRHSSHPHMNTLAHTRSTIPRQGSEINLSSNLKSALERYSTDAPGREDLPDNSEKEMLKKVAQLETAKSSAENEALTLKRNLDQCETSRATLMKQLEEVTIEADAVGKEKSRLSARLEELEGWVERAKRKLEEGEVHRKERHQLEAQLQEVRMKLATTVPQDDLDELRRHRDKAERQRDHFNEQATRYSKDLEGKERQVSRLLDELRDSQSRHEETEKARQEALSQISYLERDIKELKRRELSESERADRAERASHDATAGKDAANAELVEVTKDLKKKMSHYQQEIGRLNDLVLDHSRRADLRTKEVDKSNAQIQSLQQDCDMFRHEMETLLQCRARDEDLIKRRDDEIEELKLKNYELAAKLEGMDRLREKTQFEVDALTHELHAIREERARYEERVTGGEAALNACHDQLERLREENKRLSRQKEQLTENYNEVAYQLHKQQNYEAQIKTLTNTVDDIKRADLQSINSLQKKMKNVEEKYRLEISHLQSKLAEEERAAKILLERCEKQNGEIARLCEDQGMKDQELTKLHAKLEKIRKKELAKDMSTEESHTKMRHLEEKLKESEGRLHRILRESEQALKAMSIDVDAMVDTIASAALKSNTSGSDKDNDDSDMACLRAAMLLPAGLDTSDSSAGNRKVSFNPSRWCVDLQAKLSWMKKEINTILSKQRSSTVRLREHVQEIESLHSTIDEKCREEKALRDYISHLEKLNEQEKNAKMKKNLELLDAQAYFESSKLKDESTKESQKLQRKYNKIQATLNDVRKDLSDIEPQSESMSSQQNSLEQPNPLPRKVSPNASES